MTNDKLKPILKQIDQLNETLIANQQEIIYFNNRNNEMLQDLDKLEKLISELDPN